MTSLVTEKVQYAEKDNMWIGPREEDLIHVGAKYSPCMRADENMNRILDQYDEEIKQTACCVRNDGAGCFQSSAADCPVSIPSLTHCSPSRILPTLFPPCVRNGEVSLKKIFPGSCPRKKKSFGKVVRELFQVPLHVKHMSLPYDLDL